MSPFESWRKYLVFRHARDQDRRFREAAETRRLDLENEARELNLLEKRAKIAKQLGATREQLEPLCNHILGCAIQHNPHVVTPHALTPKKPLLLTNSTLDELPGNTSEFDRHDDHLV